MGLTRIDRPSAHSAVSMRLSIPLSEPLVTAREARYVQDALQTGWLSDTGGYVTKFESALAEKTGRAHVVAVANGTVRLELALRALDIGPRRGSNCARV